MSEDSTDRTPWVSIKVNLPTHRKTLRLMRLLDLSSSHEAAGIVVRLFCETYLNAWKDGDWKDWHPHDVEEKIGWRGDGGVLIKALQEAEWFERGTMIVHDWCKTQSRKISDRYRKQGDPALLARKPAGSRPEDPNAAREKTRRLLAGREK